MRFVVIAGLVGLSAMTVALMAAGAPQAPEAATAPAAQPAAKQSPAQKAAQQREQEFAALPAELAPVVAPRPWGDTFLPKSNLPARRLIVVKLASLSRDERIALACLQGLTSRQQPRIWLDQSDTTRRWLDWHREKGHIDGYDEVDDLPALFKQFADSYRGAIAPDAALYRGELLAINVAGCEDLIVAPPALAAQLGIPIKIDLTGRFKTYADGMRWVWQTYKDRLNHHLFGFRYPGRLNGGSFAYDVQWRGVTFWLTGKEDGAKPGVDAAADRRAIAEILAGTPPNTAVLGFPAAGENVGIGEPPGVHFISRYGRSLVCSDFLANLCVMSGVRVERLTQPKQAPPPPLEKDKVYIALVMSDGDNQNTWINFYRGYFEHKSHGAFPLAYGMGPAILDLMPAVAQWYYEHATPGTEFIADVSGIGYMQPPNYGVAYRVADREAVWGGFMDWTARYMRRLDMRSARSVGGEDEFVERYARALPFCHSLLPDMGRYSGREGIEQLTYTMSLPATGGGEESAAEMAVFRAVTSWRYGKEGFLKEVREQVGAQRPALVNGFVHCWTFRMDDLARIYSERDKDMVFVTPSQLAALYREAKAKGLAK